MAERSDVEEELVIYIPDLRAFARTFHGDPSRADDLVQEAILKAWTNLDKFKTGTNLRAWLFTILRNTFLSEMRVKRREVEDVDGVYAAQLAEKPSQDHAMELKDFERALATLPSDQREALLLIGASGFSYEEAAEICECAIGTVKSRVNRARARLTEMLSIDESDTDPTDPQMMAALGAAGGHSTARL